MHAVRRVVWPCSRRLVDHNSASRRRISGLYATSKANPADAVSKLPSLVAAQLQGSSGVHDHVLILTSRAFAPHLNPGNAFLSDLVNKLFRNVPHIENPTSTVLVVDGITNQTDGSKAGLATDGITFMTSSEVELITLDTEPVEGSIPHVDLNFSASSKGENHSLKIPAASTLFESGEHFTFFSTSWKRENGTLKPKDRKKLTSASIAWETRLETSKLLSYAVPLTEPRQVVASMGNVVRQLVDPVGKEEPLPSAEELTTSLDTCHSWLTQPSLKESFQGLSGTYALVMSPQVFQDIKDVGNNFLVRTRKTQTLVEVLESFQTSLQSEIKSSASGTFNSYDIYHKLKKGAILFRVSGGGGQWKGADRLTLESIKGFEPLESVLDGPVFDENGRISFPESQQMAPPGSFIQFFAALNPRHHTLPFQSPLNGKLEQITVGCVPYEALPATGLNMGTASTRGDFSFHRFGVVATHGYGLLWRGNKEEPRPDSMINIPFSLVEYILNHRSGANLSTLSNQSIESKFEGIKAAVSNTVNVRTPFDGIKRVHSEPLSQKKTKQVPIIWVPSKTPRALVSPTPSSRTEVDLVSIIDLPKHQSKRLESLDKALSELKLFDEKQIVKGDSVSSSRRQATKRNIFFRTKIIRGKGTRKDHAHISSMASSQQLRTGNDNGPLKDEVIHTKGRMTRSNRKKSGMRLFKEKKLIEWYYMPPERNLRSKARLRKDEKHDFDVKQLKIHDITSFEQKPVGKSNEYHDQGKKSPKNPRLNQTLDEMTLDLSVEAPMLKTSISQILKSKTNRPKSNKRKREPKTGKPKSMATSNGNLVSNEDSEKMIVRAFGVGPAFRLFQTGLIQRIKTLEAPEPLEMKAPRMPFTPHESWKRLGPRVGVGTSLKMRHSKIAKPVFRKVKLSNPDLPRVRTQWSTADSKSIRRVLHIRLRTTQRANFRRRYLAALMRRRLSLYPEMLKLAENTSEGLKIAVEGVGKARKALLFQSENSEEQEDLFYTKHSKLYKSHADLMNESTSPFGGLDFESDGESTALGSMFGAYESKGLTMENPNQGMDSSTDEHRLRRSELLRMVDKAITEKPSGVPFSEISHGSQQYLSVRPSSWGNILRRNRRRPSLGLISPLEEESQELPWRVINHDDPFAQVEDEERRRRIAMVRSPLNSVKQILDEVREGAFGEEERNKRMDEKLGTLDDFSKLLTGAERLRMVLQKGASKATPNLKTNTPRRERLMIARQNASKASPPEMKLSGKQKKKSRNRNEGDPSLRLKELSNA